MKRAVILCLALLLIFGIGFLAYRMEANRLESKPEPSIEPEDFGITAEATTQAIVPTVVPSEEAETASLETPEPSETVAEEDTGEEYQSPIDFQALWEINQYIYADISIPGTGIDYPIIQHPVDDTYYLDHTIENTSGYPGSIFTFSDNAQDMSRFNTIIYGHNMRDGGSMFTNLLNYRDPQYLTDHPEIIIYLPDREYHYTIFAAVTYDDRLINTYYNDDNPIDRQAYLDSIYASRALTNQYTDRLVTTDDHIITLSTCFTRDSDQRFLVLAVREEGDE